MGKVGKESGLHGIHGLTAIPLQNGFIIRRIACIGLAHLISQEVLAQVLGVSFQAVSKWETGTTLPDIALLPKLAVFFGIKIDDLFSVNHEDELERIDVMLQKETMTDQNYAYAKRILDGILRENPKDVDKNSKDAFAYYKNLYDQRRDEK